MSTTNSNNRQESFSFATRRLISAGLLSAAILAASALQASAQVQCGDIIEGKTTVILQNNWSQNTFVTSNLACIE